MLTLAIYPGESIKVEDDIKITVKEIADKKATLTVSYTEERTIMLGWGQSARITDDIKITAKSIKNQIKLSIEAPIDITINRG